MEFIIHANIVNLLEKSKRGRYNRKILRPSPNDHIDLQKELPGNTIPSFANITIDAYNNNKGKVSSLFATVDEDF